MTILELAESFGLTEGKLTGTNQNAYRALNPQRAKHVKEAAEMWKAAWDGNRMAALLVNEAMTTSDLFVSATGDLLDRELLAQYQDIPTAWSNFAKRATVRNFKPKKLVDIMGGRTGLESVPELTEFPGAQYQTNEYSIQASKYGRRFGFSWEAGVNDDIDELRQIPGAFANAAALTEDRAALSQIADLTTGAPNTAFFKSYSTSAAKTLGYLAFNNSGTAALTSAALEAGIVNIGARKDYEGNMLPTPRLVLVVGKALEFTAKRILAQTAVRDNTTTSTRQFEGPNLLAGAVDLFVHPLLAGTGWFLMPVPSYARPAVAVAFLTGYETPDLRVSANTGNRIGGGSIAPEEGSFEVDGVWYRVRHVTGGAQVDPIFTYASDGTVGTPGI